MSDISQALVIACKEKLLKAKGEILDRCREEQHQFHQRDLKGDEIDLSVHTLAENQFLLLQERLLFQLREIELALARIEIGTYGICEATEEPIEPDRLLSIPWTRFSIEGAELNETKAKRVRAR